MPGPISCPLSSRRLHKKVAGKNFGNFRVLRQMRMTGALDRTRFGVFNVVSRAGERVPRHGCQYDGDSWQPGGGSLIAALLVSIIITGDALPSAGFLPFDEFEVILP